MTSPYFSTRSTRNAAAKATRALLGTSKKTAANPQVKKRYHVKIEYDSNIDVKQKQEDDISDELLPTKNELKKNEGSPLKRKIVSPKKRNMKKEKCDEKEEDIWEPFNWRELLNNIRVMRQDQNAPVDSQGCERTADESETPETIRYQVLVSLMLSAQTKDQVTFAAMQRLKKHGLTVSNIMKTKEEIICQLIYPVGFWKRKASFIKQATEICKEKYENDIPGTLEGLLALPGVGPKMAHICMHAAWDKITGIGVDTHVHRISNRLGWVKKPTKTPEDTRKALEAWLPREEWETINILLVGFGQQTCLPIGPRCTTCLNHSICPYGRSAMSGRKPKKEELV